MTNLDLGGIVWLNVSRKFLSFHKFFFAENDDCLPCEFKKEIEHHSHTHSTSGNITSGATTHGHSLANTSSGYCGASGAGSHPHLNFDMDAGNSHTHTFTVNLAAGNVGALPNWATHTHACSAASCTSEGAIHTHGTTAYTDDGACNKTTPVRCVLNPHSHTTVITCTNGGTAHTHTLSGNSGNGSGTCVNHTHSISLTCQVGDDHTHAVSGPTTGSTTCANGGNHTHSALASASSGSMSHTHTVSGTSGGSSADPLCSTGVSIPVAMHHYSQMTKIHRG